MSSKYPFTGRGRSLLKSASSRREKLISINIQDNESSVPEYIRFNTTGTGFGSSLVEILTRQLEKDNYTGLPIKQKK